MRYILLTLLSILFLDGLKTSSAQTNTWELGYHVPGLAGAVNATIEKDGILYAAGYFILPGDLEYSSVAFFDGTTWTELGQSPAISTYPNTLVWVGSILYMHSSNGLYKYEEEVWTEVRVTLEDSKIARVTGASNGMYYDGSLLHIFGDITVTNTGIKYHTTWNGTSFGTVGSGFNGTVFTMTGSSSNLYFGGSFTKSGDEVNDLRGAAKWDGITLSEPFFIGASDRIYHMLRVVPNANNNLEAPVIYLSGMNSVSDNSGHTVFNKIAKFEAGQIKPLTYNDGSELNLINNMVRVVAVGDSVWLVSANSFQSFSSSTGLGENLFDSFNVIDGVSYPILNGSKITISSFNFVSYTDKVVGPIISFDLDTQTWSDYLGTITNHGFYGNIDRYHEWKGDLYAFGRMYYSNVNNPIHGIAKKTETGWEAVANIDAKFYTISTVVSNDDFMYFGGFFEKLGSNKDLTFFAAFNGTSFSTPFSGSPNHYVNDIKLIDDRLYLGGSFTKIGDSDVKGLTLLRNGTLRDLNFTVEGNFSVSKMFIEPFDDGGFTNYRIFVAGSFQNFNQIEAADNLVYWTGDSWTAFGGEFTGALNGVARYQDTLFVSHSYGSGVRIDGQVQNHYLTKWDGSQWKKAILSLNNPIFRMQASDSGLVLFGFGFNPINNVAIYQNGKLKNGPIQENIGSVVQDIYQTDETYLVASSQSKYGSAMASYRFSSSVGVENNSNLIEEFELGQNFPNPFNPSTTIPFKLNSPSKVKLSIYSILGQKVATLVDDQFMSSGSYQIQFDASELASGMYFYQIVTANHSIVKQMILIK